MRTGFTGRKRAAVAAMTGAVAAAVTGLVVAGPAGAAPVVRSSPTAVSGTEHIQIMTTSGTATTASIIVYGVFTAAGVDHMGNTIDTVVLPGGTIKVKHPGGGGPGTFNPRTCLFSANDKSGYKFVSGTGKYKGITGHGTVVVSVLGLAAKVKGACSQSAPPVAFHEVISGSGPVRLP